MLPAMRVATFGAARDPFTKALLHFDGANGQAGPFADSAIPSHVWNGTAGATLTTGTKKFGTAAVNIALGHAVTCNDTRDFDFGTQDFTLEWQEYPVNYPGGTCLISRHYAPTFGGGLLVVHGASGNMQVYLSSNGSSWDIANAASLGTITGGVWSHGAVSRQGNTFRAFRNGVITSTWTSSLAIQGGTNAFSLCSGQSANNIAAIIDELRISIGVCRYTAAFTPPTAPFTV